MRLVARQINGVNLTHEQARSERQRIHDVVSRVLPADADWLADALFLTFRGF